MEERHATRTFHWASNRILSQPDLRLIKIKIISLLRYCSLLLLATYLLIIITGTKLCNQEKWDLMTAGYFVLIMLLLTVLLWVQNRYSERRVEKLHLKFGMAGPNVLTSKECIKTDKRYVTIIGALTAIALFLLWQDVYIEQTVLMTTGTLLYILTVFMIRRLLIEKLVLKQAIGSMNQRLLVSDFNRTNFMAVAAKGAVSILPCL